MVQWSFTPKLSVTASQSLDMNCGPLLEERSDRVLNRATRVPMNACGTLVDVDDTSGMASGHQVVLSTMVRRCVELWEGGSRSTRSTITWSNLLSGTENCQGGFGVP